MCPTRSSTTNSSNAWPGSMPDETGTVTWRELLVETEQALGDVGHVADPRTEARWIVEDLVADDVDIGVALAQPARRRGVARLDELVRRRLAGEPLQYVLGHWPFRTLDLLVDRRVLIPRPETEVVTGFVIDELDRLAPADGGLVVDLGTGSGAIGLSVAAERPDSRVVLTDNSADALAVARANLAGLGIRGASVRIEQGSWFEALAPELHGACDVIASNPPYVATGDRLPEAVEAWEPASALRSGPDGLDDLRVILQQARSWLRPRGSVVLEIDPRQVEALTALGAELGFETIAHKDLAGRDRVLVARVEP